MKNFIIWIGRFSAKWLPCIGLIFFLTSCSQPERPTPEALLADALGTAENYTILDKVYAKADTPITAVVLYKETGQLFEANLLIKTTVGTGLISFGKGVSDFQYVPDTLSAEDHSIFVSFQNKPDSAIIHDFTLVYTEKTPQDVLFENTETIRIDQTQLTLPEGFTLAHQEDSSEVLSYQGQAVGGLRALSLTDPAGTDLVETLTQENLDKLWAQVHPDTALKAASFSEGSYGSFVLTADTEQGKEVHNWFPLGNPVYLVYDVWYVEATLPEEDADSLVCNVARAINGTTRTPTDNQKAATAVLVQEATIFPCYGAVSDEQGQLSWLLLESSQALRQGSLVWVLEQAGNTAQVLVPHGDTPPGLYGTVPSSVLSQEEADRKQARQAVATNAMAYESIHGQEVGQLNGLVNILARQDDWCQVQPLTGGAIKTSWIPEASLSYDLPTLLPDEMNLP